MSNQQRARLRAADFDAMVSDIAKQQSERLGLGWNQEERVEPEGKQGPRLIYNGPTSEFTACQDIVPWPSIVYDPNGYYASLGVPPWASRKEIIEAYKAKVGTLQDEGDKVRLTYIFKVMLDPERRAKYDATASDQVFVDPFVQEAIRVKDAWEASQALIRGDVTFEELADMQAALDASDQAVDDEVLARSRQAGLTAQNQIIGGGQWRWSYYVLDSSCDDHERLAKWQALLVRYISRRQKGVKLAVGFVGVTETPYEVRVVGNRTVVFLNDQIKPNRRLAKRAASAVVKQHKRATRPTG